MAISMTPIINLTRRKVGIGMVIMVMIVRRGLLRRRITPLASISMSGLKEKKKESARKERRSQNHHLLQKQVRLTKRQEGNLAPLTHDRSTPASQTALSQISEVYGYLKTGTQNL